MLTINRDIVQYAVEELSKSLDVFKESRKHISMESYVENVLDKDKLGGQRLHIYKLNSFLDSSYNFYKGNVEYSQVRELFSCLIGYEFSVYLHKVFSGLGAKNLRAEVQENNKIGRTSIDIIGTFKNEVLVKFLSVINEDTGEEPFVIPKGTHSFEAKAMRRVTTGDIYKQLKIAEESGEYTNCYGVVLSDTCVSRDVIWKSHRIGAKIIRADNITKEKIIENIMNIFSLTGG